MASYKSVRKKDNFLLKLGVTFAGIFAVLVLALFVYDAVNQSTDYDSFDHIDSYQAFPQQPESEYLVYVYSESCAACQQIQEDVFTFAESNAANMKVYFADVNNVSGSNNYPGLTGTPGILHVRNGVVINLQTGVQNVQTVMANINLEAK
ncbi:MAG: thioredoxin domain-containing protein [Candidatus Izemoplasma sp.]|nr:thioredoxin domain-containing protein [Candidatus Izemoplasma sp.]